MRVMLQLLGIPPRGRVIDLGGTWEIWSLIDHDFQITMVNTSLWPAPRDPSRHRVVVADACELDGWFEDQSFDFAFSNSVIEHVGDAGRRRRFAEQVKRLAPVWWVQTPCPSFPIEAHTGLPYYWSWPDWAKARAAESRRRHLPNWYREMEATTAVDAQELQTLFPGGLLYRERCLGLVKSVAVYQPAAGTEPPPG
jgi:hypothetical protein